MYSEQTVFEPNQHYVILPEPWGKIHAKGKPYVLKEFVSFYIDQKEIRYVVVHNNLEFEVVLHTNRKSYNVKIFEKEIKRLKQKYFLS